MWIYWWIFAEENPLVQQTCFVSIVLSLAKISEKRGLEGSENKGFLDHIAILIIYA